MNKITTSTWTILRIVILVFLIVGTVDVILIVASTFRSTVQSGVRISRLSDLMETKVPRQLAPYSRYDSLAHPSVAENIIDYKRLHLDIDPNKVVASYDVYLKKDHPLFIHAERDWSKAAAERVANEVLGAVSVSGERLKFERLETSIADTDERAHLTVTAAPQWLTNSPNFIAVHPKERNFALSIGKKEVIVHTRDVYVRSGSSPNPVSKTEDETRYVLPPNADDLYLQIERDPAAASEPQPRNTLAALLQEETTIPGFDHLAIGFLEAIPFIIFLVWCKRNAAAIPDADSQQRVIETFLVFHFSYFFLYALNNLVDDWRSPFVMALSYFEQRTLPVFSAANNPNFTYLLVALMALFIYVWPKFVRTWPPDQISSYRYKKARLILVILIPVVLLGIVTWLYVANWDTIHTNLGQLTVRKFYLLWFASLLLILSLLVLALAQATRLPDRLGVALNFFLVLMLLIAADGFYMYAVSSGNRYLRFAIGIVSNGIFIATAIALVLAFAMLAYRGITARSLHADWKEWSANKRMLLVVAVLAVALSTRYWAWPMNYWPLWWLAWELKDLFFLVLVWFLASFLRRASAENDWLKLPELTREAGILLALFLFYSSTTRWNYIPVSFIVGFLMLKFWLLPRAQFDQSMFASIKSNLNRLIERVIAFNDAERALNTLKKELLSKVGKGDIDPTEYADRLRAQGEMLEARRQELIVDERFAKDHVLALGTGTTAWENGRRTAFYSLLFSIPWTVLYLRDLVRAAIPSDSYLLLDLVTNVVYFFLAWMSYGFIFGYFYPQIRGNNGVQKALAMFVTIVVPELVWTALARPVDNANWVSFGFWTLQIFVHTMLLGMIVGDLLTMRSYGFKWRHLLDFYRLTSLSAWTSSVILAIAAAASTLITSEATHILTLAFKYVGVIPENIELPRK